MTEKELSKLRRQDFLQLLLMQGNELTEMQTKLDETQKELELTKQSNERIKARLDEKDALIEKLKGRLDAKDATIRGLRTEMAERQASRRIELDEAGSIAMAALKLNGVFEAAQQAADQYLYNLQLLVDEFGASPVRQTEDLPVQEYEMDAAEAAADAELERLLQVNREHDAADRAEEERAAEVVESMHEHEERAEEAVPAGAAESVEEAAPEEAQEPIGEIASEEVPAPTAEVVSDEVPEPMGDTGAAEAAKDMESAGPQTDEAGPEDRTPETRETNQGSKREAKPAESKKKWSFFWNRS